MPSRSIQAVVMFADVAGSTAMYENMGDIEARERISKSLNTLIAICKRHKGKLVKTIGDEILVYFQDVDLSLQAAQTIQETMENDDSPETIGISIRIGMQFGPIILEDNDIFGDTVNVAARIVAMSKARQVLFSKEMSAFIKSPEILNKARQYDRIDVKGKDKRLDIFIYAWEQEADITNMATGNMINPFRVPGTESLVLKVNNEHKVINLDSEGFTLGRSSECDLIIHGDLISRFHSSISVRRNKFILTDKSTNGTYVRTEDGQNVFLRQEEMTLYKSGVFSLGEKIEKAGDNLVYFTFE